jgi:uncharacterized membrane protein
MSRFEDSIDVNVPVRTAYNQWTQFEEFPQFMEGVERVVQRDDKTLEWTATIAGQRKEWTAEITDQTPDVRVAWKSISGDENAGAVLFQALEPGKTRITLKLDADPEGPVETVGANLGFLERRVKGDLKRFKEFIESRGTPTGAWRGEIHGEKVRSQSVNATTLASASDGFIQPSVCRGRPFSSRATASRWAWSWTERSVPFGKY